MNPFVERHQVSISSTLSCFDRVVVTGTLPDICHPRAMAGFLDYHQVRVFDFPRWAEPLREELRDNAEQIAAEAGLQIEFILKLKAFRKEARINQGDPRRARRSPRAGAHLLGHGVMPLLPTVA
jgi:hypothetical protein